MTTTETPPRWDLTTIFPALDDRSFTAALESVFANVDRLGALYDERGVREVERRTPSRDDVAGLNEVLAATNALHDELRPVNAYLNALVTTDSRNDHAAALAVELQTRTAALGPLRKRLGAWLAALGVEQFAAASDVAAAHEFALEKVAEGAEFQMGEAEESLAAELEPSGALAWQRLHRDVSSRLIVEIAMPEGDTELVPMALARGLATHPDAVRRRAAYDGELVAWESAAVPLAAALNGAKGTLGVLNRRRGFDDDLDPALRFNNVDRKTVDAMTGAVVAALPSFRDYLRQKAALLGHASGLPWWDLFAPLGDAGEVDWARATELVQGAFTGYSRELGALAERAFSEQWVDAEIRDGKRSGAYCMSVGDDVSRVMMNFDGSHDAVSTLAHELGHAYHNVALSDRTPMQRGTPMALAETASIFCETLLFETALAQAAGASERLALLDTYLVGATQIVVDIHSRFVFERELCRRRRRTALSVAELCDLMLDAQQTAYGDGLDTRFRHAYMWAVKPHYFTPFYNWPYTFGLLFGIGLFARFREDPDEFRNGYNELLAATGMADAATLASEFGIDVHDSRFWESSLDVLRAHIDDHAEAASAF